MKKVKKYIFLLLLVGGIVFGAFYLNINSIETTSEKIEKFYELAIPGSSAEIVSINEESGMFKLLIKLSSLGGTSYREAYVSKDGKILTESVVFVDESLKQIEKYKNFVDCLFENGVRIYGLNNDTATILQLNLLGRYSSKLYISCDGEMLQKCIDAGVKEVPSILINNTIETGIKTVEWFENVTECEMTD